MGLSATVLLSASVRCLPGSAIASAVRPGRTAKPFRQRSPSATGFLFGYYSYRITNRTLKV
ncbi:MAG: hypothetical protein N2747_07530 [Chitinophagaceae bacterium]|nr:hypothetical protein [Chitinophagaceae bacterium]